MALVADQFDAFPTGAATPSATGNLADAAKQATKALKCVAFTTKQVGELLARKHERVLKRIGAISEEIESLKADVMENITHQRARRTQLSEIEEDLEHAQLLGNGAVVESLYEELHVMKEETKREELLYRALCKTVRSRKESKKQFQQERLLVEEEIRTFAQKQKLIQTLLATCSKQSAGVDYTLASSASQSDCGASVLDDSDADDDDADHAHDDTASHDGASSSSSGSFPENPLLDSPPLRAMEAPTAVRKEKVLAKAVSLMETVGARSTSPKRLRVRSWSSDCVQPVPAATRDSVQTRTRHSLSVHFASPVLTVSTIKTNDEELDKELEGLDLSHYLGSINETAASPSANDEAVGATSAITEEDETETAAQPEEPMPEHDTAEETNAAPATENVVAEVVQKLVIQTESSVDATISSTKTAVGSASAAASSVSETVATDSLSPASTTDATLAA